MVVLAYIKEQSRLSLGSYALPGRRMPSFAVRGRRRMTEELKEVGVDVGHRRAGRLMRENGIAVERIRKFKATTDSDHMFNIAPNLLDRDFAAHEPNQKWAGDISDIWTREGWLYLAVILDLHSRRVIALRVLHAKPFRVTAWSVSNRMKRDLAIRALKMAIALRSWPRRCIYHSDRPSHGLQTNRERATGSKYCSHDYQKVIREHGLKASMSGKGNCYDNAAVETFSHSEPPRVFRRAKFSENCPLWNRHQRREPRSPIRLSSASVRCDWRWNTAMSIKAKLRR